jgi:hypothetical protein
VEDPAQEEYITSQKIWEFDAHLIVKYVCCRWSAVSRTDRYRKRCAADGDAAEYVDTENPLPGFIDPITLEPVVTPAVSSHGHVMGLATWKVRLI